MRILSLLIISLVLILANQQPKSPHGPDFKISCKTCHSSKGWELDYEIYSFNHNNTILPLVGQHTDIKCTQCHLSLVFSEAKTNCNECHTDIHQSSVGPDCSRCHTPVSWLVNNINEIHQTSRFPLLGAHRTADCYECHKSESLIRFDVPGVNCIDCHRDNYMATQNPNHVESGFSEDCSICHPVNSFQWEGAGFSHNFFPLVQGHSIPVCADCHIGGSYASTPTDCYACHQTDFNNTSNPNHQALGFPVNCNLCHTLIPGWRPASYKEHDSQSFPIYTGRHRGTWNSCTECHANPSNYSVFSCIICHEHNKTDMDNKHSGEGGYAYDSAECFRCHPRGQSD